MLDRLSACLSAVYVATTRRVLVAFFAFSTICGCLRHEDAAVRIDLLQLFPFTESGQETSEIDLTGTSADAYVLRGWSRPEVLSTGASVLRADDNESILRFWVGEPADRRVHFHCGLIGVQPEHSRPLPVMLQINGRTLKPLAFGVGLAEVVVDLPANVQHGGENLLALSQRRRPRRAPGHRSATASGVGCDWVHIEKVTGDVERHARLVGEGGAPVALELPAQALARYFLYLPEQAVLEFDVQRVKNLAQPQVSVVVTEDGGTPETLWTGDASATAARIDVSRFAHKLVRLDLTARGSGATRLGAARIIGGGPGASVKRAAVYSRRQRPNILLYLIDTLRADHLGTYGYQLPTSPNIDALADDALVFTRTRAQASWTKPATASLLTGRFPYSHGATTLRDGIRPGVTTLAELLWAEGYHTAAFVTNVNVGGGFGFHRGFDEFNYLPEDEARASVHAGADAVNELLFKWLESHSTQPFFVYVHVSDPHAPYTPPPGYAERFRDATIPTPHGRLSEPMRSLSERGEAPGPEARRYIQSLYDGEIAFTDENFGTLVARLKQLQLFERTAIVVAADHGEEFYDHQAFGHGYTLYEEQLAVPLLLRLPGTGHVARRVSCLARQVDLLPTLLDVLGIAIPKEVQGRSLLPAIDGRCDGDESFAQTSLARRTEISAFTHEHWKAIQKSGAQRGRLELFDLSQDGHEQHNLGETASFILSFEQQSMRQWMAWARRSADTDAAPPTVSASTMERLRVLGYAP